MIVALLTLAALASLLAGHVAVTRWQEARRWERLRADFTRNLGLYLEAYYAATQKTFADSMINLSEAFANMGVAITEAAANFQRFTQATITRLTDDRFWRENVWALPVIHPRASAIVASLARARAASYERRAWTANSRLDASLPPMPEEALDVCPICGDLTADLAAHDRESQFMHDLLDHLSRPIAP